MAGPPPKRTSRRSTAKNGGFTSLPAKGREGAIPEWPLPADIELTAMLDQAQDAITALDAEIASCEDGRKLGGLRRKRDQASLRADIAKIRLDRSADAERELWELLWTTPQAVMWDESPAFERAVAAFVRFNIRAEQGDLKAAPEARLRGQELGLTPLSLLRLRREVEETHKAEDEGKRRRQTGKPDDDTKPKKPKGDDDPRSGLFLVS